jgi:hypothetical protein
VTLHWSLENPVSRNSWGEEGGKDEGKKEAQGMRLVPVSWHEMSVKNANVKYSSC